MKLKNKLQPAVHIFRYKDKQMKLSWSFNQSLSPFVIYHHKGPTM